MLQENMRRIEAAVKAYFANAEPSVSAAISEVRTAAGSGEIADAVRLHVGANLTESQAVLIIAISRGEIWSKWMRV